LALCFQHRLRHFLHEQWDAIGALDNVQPDARGQRLVARDQVDHGGDFPVSKPVDGECSHVREARRSQLTAAETRVDMAPRFIACERRLPSFYPEKRLRAQMAA
jgi:hypothetical protein